jgi:membrane-bound lytic murein transglycosylase B
MLFVPAYPAFRNVLIACTAVLLLSVRTDQQPKAEPGVPSVEPAVVEDAPGFAAWLSAFRNEALQAGISPATFDQAFRDIVPDTSVILADRAQPEFSRPIWAYLDSALDNQRVIRGRILLRRHAKLLQRIEQRYGVNSEALVAIWGLESNFGQTQGNKSVIRSLATLAHEGRRPGFAHDQLLAALRILQHGDVRPERMIGSWAGAMGQTQFIPTTYQVHAVDFDGDGRRDIWDSQADALASTAHYLQASGWHWNQPWGLEVHLPQGFDYALADIAIQQPLAEWQRLGVQVVAPPGLSQESASLLLPAGHRGPALLIFNNFRAILKYNNSAAYGLAVGLLAERLRGRGGITADWPRDDRPLNRSERIDVQLRLTERGFDPGSADGIIGANTRQAIRAFQQGLGVPADGYASHELLEQLASQPPR